MTEEIPRRGSERNWGKEGAAKVGMQSPALSRVLPTRTKNPAKYTFTGKSPDLSKTPELIYPAPQSKARQSAPVSATFNIIATIVGGGILSLPYAFKETGWLLGIVLLFFSAGTSAFSLYLLCASARRTGTSTFIQVARKAYGPPGAHFTTFVLLVLTLFVIIAYMILVRDLFSGLLEFVVGKVLTAEEKCYVLYACLLVATPMCLSTSLHALRHMCYVGFFSLVVLTSGIACRSVQANLADPTLREEMVVATDNFTSIVNAFPILCLAFLCHFNMLSVHSSLVEPTRDRVKGIIISSVGSSYLLFIVFACASYFYAYDDVKDDILLNFESNDLVIVLGRTGMAITVLICVPMLVLPCREVTLELCSEIASSCKRCTSKQASAGIGENASLVPHLQNDAENGQGNGSNGNGVGGTSAAERDDGGDYYDDEEEEEDEEDVTGLTTFGAKVAHVVATFGIMGFCLFAAVTLPGVGAVWGVCGSSVGFLAGWGLPSLFYLRIRRKKKFNIRKLGAYCLTVITAVAMVICTRQALKNMSAQM